MSKTPEEVIAEARRNKGWTQADMAEKLATALDQTYSQRQYQRIEEGKFPKYKTEIIRAVDELLGIRSFDLIYGHGTEVSSLVVDTKRHVRQPKIETNPEKEGITFVPISAQAGYANRVTEPVFQRQLEKLYIPGLPYRGESFRIFEVEGNSMEPTFKEHFHVLTEKVEPENWPQIKEHYVYVVITQDDVLLKRIKRSKQPGHWVMISDNVDLYEPFVIPIEVVRELWFVKRKMDWEMSPPKRFEIDL